MLIDAGLAGLGDRLPAGSFEAILLTHYHIDHVQGLFPLRWGVGRPLPVIGPADPDGCDDLYRHPGILDFRRKATAFAPFTLAGLSVTPLPLVHSRLTLGYELAHGARRIAWLTDTIGLPERTRDYLAAQPPDLLVLDCSHPPAPPGQAPRNHNDWPRALEQAAVIGARQTLLTHIDHALDAWLMQSAHHPPAGVTVAQDGWVVDV